MKRSENTDMLSDALAKAQGAFPPIPKNKTATVKSQRTGATFTYKYADLADILSAIRKPLADNGLAVIQSHTLMPDGSLRVTTLLQHSSGQWQESDGLKLNENVSPQEFGSEDSYKRRYDLCTALGIAADEDEDGAIASDQQKQNKSESQQPAQSSAPRTAAKKSAPKAEAPKPEVKKEESKATESKEDTRTPQERLRDEVRVIMGNASLNIKGASIKEFIVKTSGNEKHASNDKFRLEDLSNDEAQKVYAKIAEAAKADKLADLFKGESK